MDGIPISAHVETWIGDASPFIASWRSYSIGIKRARRNGGRKYCHPATIRIRPRRQIPCSGRRYAERRPQAAARHSSIRRVKELVNVAQGGALGPPPDPGVLRVINTAIFDLDGTLVRLPTDYAAVRGDLRRVFRADKPFTPLISSIVSAADGDAARLGEAMDIVCRHETAAVSRMTPAVWAVPILRHLRERGCRICLVTMQCRTAALAALDALGVTEYFSSIITRDESVDRLEQIRRAMQASRADPGGTLVVGDTARDASCARRAGCQSILIGDGGAPDRIREMT